MNWDDLRFFLSVARTGRLSLAGQQLGVDHATVGRRVKNLEARLNANLFDKSPQGYRLTEAGEQLITHAEAIETNVLQATDQFGSEEQGLSGSVRIGASEGIASFILSEIAIDICRIYPKLEIQIVTISPSFSLSKREADLAITVSAPTTGRLKYRKISDYTLHMYATKAYLERHSEIKSIEDLKNLRGIAYVPDLIYDKELDYQALVGSYMKPHLTSNSVHVQLASALLSGGICILHDFMAKNYDQLVKILPDQISFERSYYFVVHEDYAQLQRIRIVSDAIIKGMRERLG